MSTRRSRRCDRRRDTACGRTLQPSQPRGAGQRFPKTPAFVIPAQAGIQWSCDCVEPLLGPRLRGGDGNSGSARCRGRRERRRDTACGRTLPPSQLRGARQRLPKTPAFVIPAQAGIQWSCDCVEPFPGPRLRGGDGNRASARRQGRRDRRRETACGRTLPPSQLRGAGQRFPKTPAFVIPAQAGIQWSCDCVEPFPGPRLRGGDGNRASARRQGRRDRRRETACGRTLPPSQLRGAGQRFPKTPAFVIPAQAGIQWSCDCVEPLLGPRLRGGDGNSGSARCRGRRNRRRDTARGRPLPPSQPRTAGQRLPKTPAFVIPAQAGIQCSSDCVEPFPGPRLRGGDGNSGSARCQGRRERRRDTARGRASITRRRAQAPASTGPQRGPHTSRPLRGDTA